MRFALFRQFGAGPFALLRRNGPRLAADFQRVVVDGAGDAAIGISRDLHDFGQVEVGRSELVQWAAQVQPSDL